MANIFSNNPNVYWGFTAATGGANNVQQFRVNALGVQLSDITICSYDTVQVDPQINTSAYTYLWSQPYGPDNHNSSYTIENNKMLFTTIEYKMIYINFFDLIS